MSVFAQLGTKESDNEFLEQLSNVVNRVRGEIEDSWSATQAAELQSQADFEATLERTHTQIATLQANQSELEAALASLNRCIVEQTGVVASATAKRDRNQRLWDEAAAYCATGEDQYQTSTKARRDELDLLDTLRGKVTARWGDFEDIEKERIRAERARKQF
jgi:peptidoglycan hydrolase CwlO-like protein